MAKTGPRCPYCDTLGDGDDVLAGDQYWCPANCPVVSFRSDGEGRSHLRVYVAGPYTDGAWEHNIRDVVAAADKILAGGHVPFIPHTMTTLWALISPRPKEVWLEFDLAWLDACDALVRIDGGSPGAETEIDHAENQGIPVYYGIDAFLQEVGKQ